MDYPVWNCPQSGILATRSFVAAGGAVYLEDVFVKPSVADRRLDVEATLRNTGGEASGEIRWQAVEEASGKVAHEFAPQAFQDRRRRVAEPWT